MWRDQGTEIDGGASSIERDERSERDERDLDRFSVQEGQSSVRRANVTRAEERGGRIDHSLHKGMDTGLQPLGFGHLAIIPWDPSYRHLGTEAVEALNKGTSVGAVVEAWGQERGGRGWSMCYEWEKRAPHHWAGGIANITTTGLPSPSRTWQTSQSTSKPGWQQGAAAGYRRGGRSDSKHCIAWCLARTDKPRRAQRRQQLTTPSRASPPSPGPTDIT